MIYTSYFSKKKEDLEDTAYCSIAVCNPKYDLPYELKNASTIKPYGIFNKYSGEQYVEKYFERLEKIGVDRILEDLRKAQGDKKNLVLMCYEKNPEECHRSMFAKWWLAKTGEVIEEYEERKNEQLTIF